MVRHNEQRPKLSLRINCGPATTWEPPLANSFSSLEATHASSGLKPRTSGCSLSTGYNANQTASVNDDTESVNRYSKMLADASSEDKVACWLEESHLFDTPEDASGPTPSCCCHAHRGNCISPTVDEVWHRLNIHEMLIELPLDAFNSRIDILADHPELFDNSSADGTERGLIQHALKWNAIVPQETQCLHSLALFRMAKSVDVSFRHQLFESLKLEKSSARNDFQNMLASVTATCKAVMGPWDNKSQDNEPRDIELPSGPQFMKDTLYRSSSRNGSLAGGSSSAASSIASSVSLTD